MYRKEKETTSLFKEHPWLWIIVAGLGLWLLSDFCESSRRITRARFSSDDQYIEDHYVDEDIIDWSNEYYYEPDPPIISSCSCFYNEYNCDDFSSHREAQACFERCMDLVGYDIHWLDGDDDGIACEWNP